MLTAESRHEAIREEQRREALRLEQAAREEAPHAELNRQPEPVMPKAEAPEAGLAKPEAARPEAPKPEAPKVDSKVLLESSGLVMIETDRSKAASVMPQAEPPQPLGRPRRERPRHSPQDEELQQVETKR